MDEPAVAMQIGPARVSVDRAQALGRKCAEAFGVDLAAAARDPAERLRLISAYCIEALCDERSSRQERGAAARLLLETVSVEERLKRSIPGRGGMRRDNRPWTLGWGLGGSPDGPQAARQHGQAANSSTPRGSEPVS